MMTRNKVGYLIVPILLALAFSAFTVTPALADDGTPPPTDPVVTDAPPTGTGTDTSVVVPDPAPLDISTPADTSSSTSVDAIVTDPAPADATTPADVLAQLPEDTNVVVTDASGATVPLATQEAASAIVNGDPMWCPTGTAPGAATCSKSYSDLYSLVNQLSTTGQLTNASAAAFTPSGSGVVWIKFGTDGSTGAILIDGSNPNFGSIVDANLTLQGGWNGAPGSTALDSTTPYSTITKQLSITNWTGNVTLNNLNITLTDPADATNVTAVHVTTKGSITANLVNVLNNMNSGTGTFNGAILDNTSSTVQSVTINNSSFSGNEGYGLEALSTGVIIGRNLSASDNQGGTGAYLDNHFASSDKAVTLTGYQQFNHNLGGSSNGLYVFSNGAITVSNLTANHNGFRGAYLDNRGSTSNAGIVIGGVNQFNYNADAGLDVYSHGAITLSNVTAMDNTNWGVYLDNADGGTAPSGKPVTVNGSSNVVYETLGSGHGLEIESMGAITVGNITASKNNGPGVYLFNQFSGAAGGITINGYGVSTGNFGYGLEAFSYGNVVLNNMSVTFNGTGAYIDNCKLDTTFGSPTFYIGCLNTANRNVTMNGSNSFSNNTGYGLEVLNGGNLTTNNLTASNNGYGTSYNYDASYWAFHVSGARFFSWVGSLTNTITMTGYNTFNHNGSFNVTPSLNHGWGLDIETNGAVTINNLTANGNAEGGVYLSNGIVSTAAPKPITVTGVNNFNNSVYGGYGLYIRSSGALTVSNISASNNNGGGALLQSTNSSVTVNGYSYTTGNGYYGLQVLSAGNILLTNITSEYNNNNGAYVDNCIPDTSSFPVTCENPTSHTVTLNGTNSFSNNSGYGLEVISTGAIIANNLTADNNSGGYSYDYNVANWNVQIGGVSLNNALGSGNVTMLGSNQFVHNTYDGIDISSRGVVVTSNLTATNNTYGGFSVDNSTAISPKAVTLNGLNTFSDNGWGGLSIYSAGVVTTNNITANGNGSSYNGAYINNAYGTPGALSPAVYIRGSNTFNGNGFGLEVLSYGAINLNNITASYNVIGDGVNIDNSGGVNKAVTLTGVNTFNDNGSGGLYVASSGAVSLTRVTANNNITLGVNVSTPSTILLTCGYATGNNTGFSLWSSGGGLVTVRGLYSLNVSSDVFSAPHSPIVYPCALP